MIAGDLSVKVVVDGEIIASGFEYVRMYFAWPKADK
jgi:hypothetical protein